MVGENSMGIRLLGARSKRRSAGRRPQAPVHRLRGGLPLPSLRYLPSCGDRSPWLNYAASHEGSQVGTQTAPGTFSSKERKRTALEARDAQQSFMS